MPRTPAEPDEDLAIPMVVESRAPVVDESPLGGSPARGPARAQPSPVVMEASRWSPADDLALLSAEIAVRSDASRSVLLAARAFLRDPLGGDPAVLADWRAAFQLAPRSWVAFWGVRRALSQAPAWEEWLAVLDAALGSRTPEDPAQRGADHAGASAGAGAGAGEGDAGVVPGAGDRHVDPGVEPSGSELRAAQWLEQGRLLEERLGRPDEAGTSYRAGLRESPEHAGLLIALFWLGCEQGDDEMRAEALEGMLRRPSVWAKRAALTVVAVRCRRGDTVGGRAGRPGRPDRGDGGPRGRARPEARRELLMRTLASAGSPDTRPLLEELAREARATSDDLGQAVAWTDLAARLAPAEDGLAAAMLRRASRLYRRRADQLSVAEATLRAAWRHDSRHPLVAAELAVFLEVHGARDGRSLVGALADLLPADLAAAGDVPLTEAGSEIAARWLTACLAAPSVPSGGPPAGTGGPAAPSDATSALGAAGAFLDGHRRFGHARLDELALRLAVRARAGDGNGLASAFARVAELLATAVGPGGGMVAGRQGHLPAAAGWPDAGAGGASGAGGGAGALDVRGEAHAFTVCGIVWQSAATDGSILEAERAWRRALAASPASSAPAWDRLGELLRRQRRWNELAELLANRLDAIGEAASIPARVGWLEELVVLHRDRLDDPESAVRHHDHLARLCPDRTRHLVRRWDLELELAEMGRPSALPVRLELLRALAAAVPGTGTALGAALSCEAAELALGGGGPEARTVAARLFEAALPHASQGQAASGLERLASSPAERAAIVEQELTWARRRWGERASRHGAPLRALAFRVAWRHHLDREPVRAVEALAPLVVAGDPAARALTWHLARGSGDPALARRALEDARGAGIDVLPLELPFDGAEALERTGALGAAEDAYRALVDRSSGFPAGPEGGAQGGSAEMAGDGPGAGSRHESVEAALGWLRVAAALRNATATRAATRALAAVLSQPERRWLEREARLLAVLDARAVPAVRDRSAAPVHEPEHEPEHGHGHGQDDDDGPNSGPADPGAGLPGHEPAVSEEPADAVLRWALGIRSGDPLQVASGLLAIAAITPGDRGEDHGPPDGGHGVGRSEREGLLVRAALRARLGGPATAASVHAHALALARAGVPSRERNLEVALACSLSDLPVEGRPERVSARLARAARLGGCLGYALELECALDAEERSDSRGALDGFARALACDACGIEALDGLRRVAAALGDRRGAASAGLRLGAVIRTPVRAAAELERAARLLEELGLRPEAAVAYGHARAREPRSDFLFARLEALLADLGDTDGLERLYSGRLAGETERGVRSRLLLARGRHRMSLGAARRGAVHDFERVLALEPHNAEAVGHLLDLATGMGALAHAIRYAERLVELEAGPERRGALRLRLAALEASAGQRAQAIATLRQCTRELPGETVAWEQLTALADAGGDPALALEALRGWEAGLVDQAQRARLWMRIGMLERAADPGGHRLGAAVVALRTAVALGAGVEGQLALADALADAGEWSSRARLLSDATEQAVRRSRDAPTDVGCLRELHALSERAGRQGGDAGAPDDAAPMAGRASPDARGRAEPGAEPGTEPGTKIAGNVAAQILGVLGDAAAPAAAPLSAVRFVGELVPPLGSFASHTGPLNLAAAIWAVVASAADSLLAERAPRSAPGARTEISAAMQPELAWIEGMAVSLGIPTLQVSVARGASGVDRQPARGPDHPAPGRPAAPTDARAVVAALDGPRPELVLASDVSARAREPAVRFEVARTVGLLREHALAFDAITDAELTALFRSAVVLGGGAEAPATRSAGVVADDPTSGALGARALGRALSRKARKSLVQAMEGTDLGALDPPGFRAAALEMADRVGLGSCGDLGAAIRAMDVPLGAPVMDSPRAVRLLRYALSEVFLTAPRERVGVVPLTSFGPGMDWVDEPPRKPPEPREPAAPVRMTLNQQEDADQWESELAEWDASLPVLLTPEQPRSGGAGSGGGDPAAEEVARWFDEEPPADDGLGRPADAVARTDREATLPEMTEEAWREGIGRFIHVGVDVHVHVHADVGLGAGSDADPARRSLAPDSTAWTGLARLLEDERARAQPPARAFDLHLALARVLERLGEVAEAEAHVEAALDAPGMGSASAGATAAHRARLCLAERAGHADEPRAQESLQRLALAAHPDQPAYRALWAEWTLARAGRGEVDGAASAYVAAIPDGLGRALAEAELVWSRPATAAAILETAAHRSRGPLGAGLLTLAAALTEHAGDVAAAAEQRFAAARLDGGSPPPPPTAAANAAAAADADADADTDTAASADAHGAQPGPVARRPWGDSPIGDGRPSGPPPPPLGLIRDVARLAPAPGLALLAVLMERLGPSPLKVALARWGSWLALRTGDRARAARQLFEADDVLGPPSLALARARLDVLGSASAASLPGSPLEGPPSEPPGGAGRAEPESIFEHGAAALAEAIQALDRGPSGEPERAARLCLAFSAGVFGAMGPATRGPAVEHLLAGLTDGFGGPSEVQADAHAPTLLDARRAPSERDAVADWAPLGPALEVLAMQAPPGSEARSLALERWGRLDVARRARAWILRHDGLVALGRTEVATTRLEALWEELPVRFPDLLPGSTLPWRASAWAKARGRGGRSAAWLDDMARLGEDAGSIAESDHPFGRALRELARERRAPDAAPPPPGPETGVPGETMRLPDAASEFAAWLVSGAGLRAPARPAGAEPPPADGALGSAEPTPGSSLGSPLAAPPGGTIPELPGVARNTWNAADHADAHWLGQPGPAGFWSVFAATWAAFDAPAGYPGRQERVHALAMPGLTAPAFRRSAVRLLRRGVGWERAGLGPGEIAAGTGASALALVEAAEAEEDLGHMARAHELFQSARTAPDSAAAAAVEADIRLGTFRCAAAAGRLWPVPGSSSATLSEAERALIDLEALDEAIADGRFEEALGLLVDAPPHESTPGAETWAFAASLARGLVPNKPELSSRLWARAEDLAIRPRAAAGPDHDPPVIGKGLTALFRLADPGRATDGVRRARAQELLAELARVAAPGDPASAALFWWMEAAGGWTEDTDSVELERHLRRSLQSAHAIPASEGGPPLPVVMAWRRWLTASGRLREAALAAATEAETLRTPHAKVAALMRAVDLETELDEGRGLPRPDGGPEGPGAGTGGGAAAAVAAVAGRRRAASPTPGGGRADRRRRDWLRDILEIAPDHAEAFIRLGQMYASEGRHREWSEVLVARLTATRNPFEQTALRLALADCLLGPVGDLAGARRELGLVLEREPQHAGALARLADLEEIAGNLPAVAEFLMRQAAVERSGERRLGLFLRLGRLLLGAGARDPARAALAYGRALQLSPDHREALEALSGLYLELGETKAGLAVTDKLLRATEEPRARAALSLRKGRMLDRAGDARAAQLTFRHALEICPTELGSLDELLRLLDRSHDLVGGRFVLDDLVHRLRGMLAEHPGDLAVARALATLLKRRGRPAAAEAVREWCGWILERGGPRPPAPGGAPDRAGRSGAPPPPPSPSLVPSTGDDASTGRRLAALTAPGHEEVLFPPTVPPAFRRLCRALGPLLLESASSVLAERAGALGLGRGQRLAENPVARATWDEVGAALGVGPFQLHLVSAPPPSGAPRAGSEGDQGVRGPVEVLPAKVPTVVARLECLTLGGTPLGDGDGPPSRAQRAALRFAAGRSLFLVSSGLDFALVGGLATLAVWLTAVVRQFVPDHHHPAADPDEVERWTGRFARQLSRRSRQELAPFALECSGPLALEALRAGVLDAANRVGLVAAGSLAICAEVLASAGGGTAPAGGSAGAGLDRELGPGLDPELASLLAFATSDDLDVLLALGD
jgi:tetratricopeptide (TPR) repeat protein